MPIPVAGDRGASDSRWWLTGHGRIEHDGPLVAPRAGFTLDRGNTMNSKHKSPIWPYLGILACLFALSVTAPRAWHRIARHEPLSNIFFARQAVPEQYDDVADAPPYEAAQTPWCKTAQTPWRETGGAAEIAARQAINDELLLGIDGEHRDRWPTAAEPSDATTDTTPSYPPEVPATEPSPQGQATPDPNTTSPDDWSGGPSDTNADDSSCQPAEGDAEPTDQSTNSPLEFDSDMSDDIRVAGRPGLHEHQGAASSEGPPAEPSGEPAVASSAWPKPQALLAQLEVLTHSATSVEWARQTSELVEDLCRHGSDDVRTSVEILRKLRKLAALAPHAPKDPQLDTLIARAEYSLTRRLDLWESALKLERLSLPATTPQSPAELIASLAKLESMTRKGMAGAAWRDYLQLDNLRRLTIEGATEAERRAAARVVLDRMASSSLSREQRRFLDDKAVVALYNGLRVWAAEPVSAARLLAHIEEFERTGLPSAARLLAQDYRGLAWSAPAEAEQASQQIDMHYRNANARVSMNAALANRLMPQPEKMVSEVNDRVVNVPVFGTSTTFAKMSVRFIPDPERIRIGIEAEGRVDSSTVSISGPATFRNQGRSTFIVRKLMVLGPYGLTVWPAVAEADNDFNYLVSLETDFDGRPLVGSLVRNIARSQHDEARDVARMEVEQKVAWKARKQLDAEMQPHLTKLSENVENKQVAALKRLGMELVPVEMSTTADRIVGRARLGSPEQLGAHTPRPRAPSDSWLSVQIHQSALNNGLEQLKLDGRTFELAELFAWIGKRLNRPNFGKTDDLPENVRIKFADKDAVRLRADGDRVEVKLAIAELTQGKNKWRNFTVRTMYRPQPRQLDPEFVRDDTIFLESDTKAFLKHRPLAIAIFSKVFSTNRAISLMDQKIANDPRLQDLSITQLVIEDGWIAIAYSPRRTAASSHAPRAKK